MSDVAVEERPTGTAVADAAGVSICGTSSFFCEVGDQAARNRGRSRSRFLRFFFSVARLIEPARNCGRPPTADYSGVFARSPTERREILRSPPQTIRRRFLVLVGRSLPNAQRHFCHPRRRFRTLVRSPTERVGIAPRLRHQFRVFLDLRRNGFRSRWSCPPLIPFFVFFCSVPDP